MSDTMQSDEPSVFIKLHGKSFLELPTKFKGTRRLSGTYTLVRKGLQTYLYRRKDKKGNTTYEVFWQVKGWRFTSIYYPNLKPKGDRMGSIYKTLSSAKKKQTEMEATQNPFRFYSYRNPVVMEN